VAKRRVARRGRSTVALVLLAFVAVATSVIWRRAQGVARAADLTRLTERVQQLESEREKLAGELRDAASRRRLAPVVEQRLNMRVPHDSQVIILERRTTAPPTRP
jgi:cell division protein FtsL